MPKLVNRGPAGLLVKLQPNEGAQPSTKPTAIVVQDAPINKIANSLSMMIVDINSLTSDPDNARLHPDRNMKSIKDSLKQYGQVKPIVVRKDKMLVVAGNGTLEAAKLLGWTKIAASIVDMDDVTAAGYGLADNRSAELAKWDFEVVARLDALLLEAGHASIGWSLDELEVLRAADWTPPAVEDDESVPDPTTPNDLLLSFTPDQYSSVELAINKVRELLDDPELDRADCLVQICLSWCSE